MIINTGIFYEPIIYTIIFFLFLLINTRFYNRYEWVKFFFLLFLCFLFLGYNFCSRYYSNMSFIETIDAQALSCSSSNNCIQIWGHIIKYWLLNSYLLLVGTDKDGSKCYSVLKNALISLLSLTVSDPHYTLNPGQEDDKLWLWGYPWHPQFN